MPCPTVIACTWLSLLGAVAVQEFPPLRTHELDVGLGSSQLLAGDLTGDGWPELVVAMLPGVGYSRLGVALNGGRGDLPRSIDDLLPVPDLFPVSPVLADLDGDGHLDLASVGWLVEDRLRVAFGDGSGGFPVTAWWPTPQWPTLCEAGDLDGDGRPDLVAVSPSDQRARSYRNLGGRQLVADGDTLIAGLPGSSALADLDDDGDPELLLLDADTGLLAVHAGTTGLTFGAATSHGLGVRPAGLLVADADGDGRPDVLAGSLDPATTTVFVRQGDGAGGLGPLGAVEVGAGQPASPRLADLDEDGVLDLVVALPAVDALAVLRGQGGGAFASGTTLPAGNGPARLLDVDLDQDGDLDLLVSHQQSDLVTLLHGQGDRTFDSHLPVGEQPRDVAAGDLDGDGWEDLVAGCYEDDALWVALSLGFGRFARPARVAIEGTGEQPLELELGDLDGDGRLDVIVLTGQKALWWLAGAGDGILGPPVLAAPAVAPTGLAENLRLAELDGDGALDAVLVAGGASQVLLGRGDGTFAAPVALLGVARALELGDADGDGLLDLVDRQEASLIAHLGDGEGAFSHGMLSPTQLIGGDGLALGDTDGDGTLDAVVTSHEASGEVLTGLGDGTFVHRALLQDGGGQTLTVSLADLDGDSHLDLVTSDYVALSDPPGRPVVHRGLGDGTFSPGSALPVFGRAFGSLARDLDGNGAPDLVVTLAQQFLGGSQSFLEARHLLVLANRCGPWTGLGQPLAGSPGTPTLRAAGSLAAGTDAALSLTDGLPGGTAWLVVGLSVLGAPFRGGVLLPHPDLVLPLALDGEGGVTLTGPWPAGLPAGVESVWQAWLPDPAGPAGFSASNGLRATTP